jgi:hypothetical protein
VTIASLRRLLGWSQNVELLQFQQLIETKR